MNGNLSSAIGETGRICPYCCTELPSMPSRKTKCASCGKAIYVRTRPVDRQRVLVTETQAAEIESQWQKEQARKENEQEYLSVKEDFDRVKSDLAKKQERDLSDDEILVCVYEKQSLSFAAEFKWGLYRNARLRLAQVLLRQNLHRRALGVLIETCYVDANGPRNCGTTDLELLRRFPPFDPTQGFQAPAVLHFIAEISDKLPLSESELKNEFLRLAKEFQYVFQCPLSAEVVWEQVGVGIAVARGGEDDPG